MRISIQIYLTSVGNRMLNFILVFCEGYKFFFLRISKFLVQKATVKYVLLVLEISNFYSILTTFVCYFKFKKRKLRFIPFNFK